MSDVKWECPECWKTMTTPEGSEPFAHYRPNTHEYSKDVCHATMERIVDTAKYRSFVREYEALWGEKHTNKEPIGVRGADLKILLDAYDRLRGLLK